MARERIDVAHEAGNIAALVCPIASVRRFRVLAVMLVSVAFSSSWTVAFAQAPERSKEDLARARALDKEGAKAYGEERYVDAIRYFEEAYRLGGPAFELWNVAKCYLRLEQPEQAVEMLERYLAIPNIPKEDRAEATRQLETVKKRPSPLTVSSSPSGAEVSVDGKKVEGRTPLSTFLAPGAHVVTVSLSNHTSYTRGVEARYGRAVIVDAPLNGDVRPPPPSNPYDAPDSGPITLRGAFNVVLPRHGTVGGNVGAGLLALGTYRLTVVDGVSLSVGGLFSASGDSWDNQTGTPNAVATCAELRDAQRATAMSVYGVGALSFALHSKVNVGGIGGVGLAGYFVGDVGGDLFVPSCDPSPGVRPALLVGVHVDYALTKRLRLSAFPLTWQIHPSFAGTRSDPRDASSAWMRFGIGIGAGVDL